MRSGHFQIIHFSNPPLKFLVFSFGKIRIVIVLLTNFHLIVVFAKNLNEMSNDDCHFAYSINSKCTFFLCHFLHHLLHIPHINLLINLIEALKIIFSCFHILYLIDFLKIIEVFYLMNLLFAHRLLPIGMFSALYCQKCCFQLYHCMILYPTWMAFQFLFVSFRCDGNFLLLRNFECLNSFM